MDERGSASVGPLLPPLAVLCPTTGERVVGIRRMAESVKATVPTATVYLGTPNGLRMPSLNCVSVGFGHLLSYPKGINQLAARAVKDGFEWLFVGADDLVFHPGWYEAALAAAGDDFEVIGTNDLGNPHVIAGRHATHFLVRARYLERGVAGGSPGLMYEGYRHQFVDNELVATATARGLYTQALDSHVEHMHAAWGKAPMDETYADYGFNSEVAEADEATFRERISLWQAVA